MSESGSGADRCFTPDEAELLALGATIDERAARHLDSCAACRALLEQASTSNRFISQHLGALRQAMAAPPGAAGEIAGATPMPTLPGFRLIARVSEGGQGVVYKAIQVGARRKVAIKFLRHGRLATERQLHRFERETELLATLHHPHIVAVYDGGRSPEGQDYLVMEWINGVSLDRYLRDRLNTPASSAEGSTDAERTEISPSERRRRVLEMFVTVARAMEHAHGGSVIHRDLKPSNILVDERGQPHIIDFGLARLEVGGRGELPTMTEDFVGTRAYASPEQVSGSTDALRVTTDVYSLGVMLFEALTGEFPYPVQGRASEVDRHIQATPPRSPRAIDPSIGEELATIVLKALSKEPARRYASAGQLADDLEALLAGRAISAKRESSAYVLRCWLRRHKREAWLGFAAGVLLVGASAAVIWGRISAADARAETARAKSERDRAQALAMVVQAVTQTDRSGSDASEGYAYNTEAPDTTFASRALGRLQSRISLGWPGKGKGLSPATSLMLAPLLTENGRVALAEEVARNAAVERRMDMGPDDPALAIDSQVLAEILYTRGQWQDAQRSAERALQSAERDAEDHGAYLGPSLELLARTALKQSDASKALDLSTRALGLTEKAFGADSLEHAQVLATRAQSLVALGRWHEADESLTPALRIRLGLVPDESSLIADTIRLLADILEQEPGAESIHPAAAAIGERSPTRVAARLRTLAGDLERLISPKPGPRPDPIETLERMLSLKQALLRERHPGLLSTIAALVVEPGLYAKPRRAELLGHAVNILDNDPSASPIAKASALERQALSLLDLGRADEAIAAWERSVDLWWSLPDGVRDDTQAATNERGLAMFQLVYGKYEQAEARCRHVLDVMKPVYGPDHKMLSIAMGQRALALAKLGRGEEAEREARGALAMRDRLNARGSPVPPDQGVFTGNCAGLVLVDRGDYAVARALIEPGLSIDWFAGPHSNSVWSQKLLKGMVAACEGLDDPEGTRLWKARLEELESMVRKLPPADASKFPKR